MITVTRRYKISILTILTILSFSTFLPALAHAAPLAVSEKDWERVNGNSWAHNNSPQTQINKNNVRDLEVNWIFPIASSSQSAWMQALPVGFPADGSTTPPIVKNGIVYITTVGLKTIAIDAKSGKEVWSYQYTIDIEEIQKRVPIQVERPHLHGIRYWAGQDALIVPGAACEWKVIDAKTGKEKFTIGPVCIDIPGSIYPYQTFTASNAVADVGVYEKGQMFITAIASNDGKTVKSGRSAIIGVDMNNPSRVIWRVFTMPPQDRPVDDWALQECDIGWFYTIPCKEVREKARDNLMNDWQYKPGVVPHWTTGATANWGQTIVDEDTGYIYIATGDATPFPQIEYRTGPNLYSATLMAIDANTGKMKWWVQDAPRDPWDYDCNWNGLLIDDTRLGKVYVKGCKLGYLHVRNALTGEKIHYIDVLTRGQYDPKMGTSLRSEHFGSKGPLNPLSKFEMKELKIKTQHPAPPVFTVKPTFLHGSFGSDISYNKGAIFHYVQSGGVSFSKHLFPDDPVEAKEGAGFWSQMDFISIQANATLVARDLVTGNVKWMHFYPNTGVRAYPTITGGIVILPLPDGHMRLLDEDNGRLLREINLGAAMVIGSTVGKDSDGNSKIFVLVGASGMGFAAGFMSPAVPGSLVSIGLSERAAQAQTTTVTTTATTATTTTVISTQPAKTTTVTSQITESVGLPSEVTYAAVAVAVIAIIAAAVLTTRRKTT